MDWKITTELLALAPLLLLCAAGLVAEAVMIAATVRAERRDRRP